MKTAVLMRGVMLKNTVPGMLTFGDAKVRTNERPPLTPAGNHKIVWNGAGYDLPDIGLGKSELRALRGWGKKDSFMLSIRDTNSL